MSSPARLPRLAGGIAIAATTLGVALFAAASPHGPTVARAATYDPTPTPTPSDATPTPLPTDTPWPTRTPWPSWSAPPPTVPPASAPATAAPHKATATSTPRPATPRATAALRATPTAAVLGAIAQSSPAPTASTSVTPIGGGGGGPSATATRVPDPQATVLTAAGMGGTAALLSVAVTWRLLRPRRRARLAGAAVLPGAAAVAPPLPESPLLRSWKAELDDLADLAALTVPPEELPAARERRRAFDVDGLARRLVRSVEEQGAEG